ncbi:hypothetical protein [Tsukamurella strandjordii]|uniref:Uncharacterized protein n=1 Tax=Tsukamurella strandjordii TaxID=147577 RepID=A0AA90SMZ0_9ACTN|nr:hypothetical protein [Tsukamurella strandjordii]MDP0399788.1 hypothetical protein [Tsukamurella strandjordii]
MNSPEPQSYRPTLVVGPDDAGAYLERLGITSSVLLEALEAGERRASEITKFHPVTAAGLTRWIEVVGVLRDGLAVDADWIPSDDLNRPVTTRPDFAVSLSVVGGDELTGSLGADHQPKAARRRGSATTAALRDQLELITVAKVLEAEAVAPLTIADAVPEGQWFLLYHREKGTGKLFCEVSKARDISDGQFTGWLVRVILDPLTFGGADVAVRPLDEGGDDLDFKITDAG